MLYTIAVFLLIAWLLGIVGTYTIGAFVHVLLVVAVLDGGHFFGEGLPGRPAAADGHCDGDGPVHDRGRR